MSKVRVLQVIGSLRVGGAETVALNYYKYIDRNLFEFDYLVYGDEIGDLENQIIQLNGRILRIPSPQDGFIKFTKNVRKILREYGPYDVIHSHPLHNSGFIMKAAYMERVPKRITHAHSARQKVHTSLVKKIYNNLMKYSIQKFSTHMLACSESAGDYLFEKKHFYKKGIIINNGIDVKKYSFDKCLRNEVRKQYKLDDNFVIGHVGRLCDVKNQDFILDIFSKVKEKHVDSKLIFIGDGSIKEQLIIKAKKLSIYDDVLFLGSRNDVHKLLQGMDVFLFPSKYEGLGIAVIEAQAAGTQCVISDTLPKEVNISNLISRISLSLDNNSWAEEVLKHNNKYQRIDTTNEIVKSGYDMNHIMKKITHIYVD